MIKLVAEYKVRIPNKLYYETLISTLVAWGEIDAACEYAKKMLHEEIDQIAKDIRLYQAVMYHLKNNGIMLYDRGVCIKRDDNYVVAFDPYQLWMK